MASAVQSAQSEVLTQIFQGLKSKNHDVRLQSAQELRRYVSVHSTSPSIRDLWLAQVTTTVAEMSSDAAAKLWDDNINRRLFELMHSQNTSDKFGGLLAIGTLQQHNFLNLPDVSQTIFLMSTEKKP